MRHMPITLLNCMADVLRSPVVKVAVSVALAPKGRPRWIQLNMAAGILGAGK